MGRGVERLFVCWGTRKTPAVVENEPGFPVPRCEKNNVRFSVWDLSPRPINEPQLTQGFGTVKAEVYFSLSLFCCEIVSKKQGGTKAGGSTRANRVEKEVKLLLLFLLGGGGKESLSKRREGGWDQKRVKKN